MHLRVKIFIIAQFLPTSFAALVLLLPSSIPSPSSYVKDNLLHIASNSLAILFRFYYLPNPEDVPALQIQTSTLTSPTEGHANSCKGCKTKTASTCTETQEHLTEQLAMHLTEHLTCPQLHKTYTVC